MITFVKLEFLFDTMGLFDYTSCVILSAGNSERMGTPKALLKFDSQTTFIEKIINTYLKCGIKDIVIVINSDLYEIISVSKIKLPKEVVLVINKHPEHGRFYSLKSGLEKIKKGNGCFFQNIDNPFTSSQTLLEMLNNNTEFDLVIPVFNDKRGHPVLISSEIVNQTIKTPLIDVPINIFLRTFKPIYIEVQDVSIQANINSQADYAFWFSHIKKTL